MQRKLGIHISQIYLSVPLSIFLCQQNGSNQKVTDEKKCIKMFVHVENSDIMIDNYKKKRRTQCVEK